MSGSILLAARAVIPTDAAVSAVVTMVVTIMVNEWMAIRSRVMSGLPGRGFTSICNVREQIINK